MDHTLKALIGQTDDDYLIGLSNKGTVKRAYKDLPLESPTVRWQEDAAEVTLKEVTCVIREPLAESTCSCPSRNICRHVVTAVLWLKQEFLKESSKKTDQEAERERCELQENEEHAETTRHGSEKRPEILEELFQLSTDRLKRVCRGKHYQQFLARLRAGELPVIEESSIVTVTIPWENVVVKLLKPFAYSACTCHSKELCVHKALAVLACQFAKGKIGMQDLEESGEDGQIWDPEQVRMACQSVCGTVEHQVCTGLSRQSPESPESLERLAVICHRAQLPALEVRLREAASMYRQYFERSAAFRSGELFCRLLAVYELAGKLGRMSGQEEIRALAGSFRDSYQPAGQLHLVGMGGRTFSSRTGYEGEIFYFLEPEQKRWYTWTDARPVFYEGVRRRPPDRAGNDAAPWGLNCSRMQLQSLEFCLQNAKAASGGRLSVSKESKGEVIGERNLCRAEIKDQIFWDYEALLKEHFAICKKNEETDNRVSERREKLVLVGALGWDESRFDTVEQRFSWNLYDQYGRKLFIRVRYRKEEKLTIQFLERLEKRLLNHPRKAILFFGSVYLDEDGHLCLFPVEVFLKEAEEIAEQEGLTDTPDGCFRKDTQTKEAEGPSEEILKVMERYRREAAGQLSDLFVSGLYSVQENTAARLLELSENGEQMGLHSAGAIFARIRKALEEQRHQTEYMPGPILHEAQKLDAYLNACRKKLSFDMALLAMKES